VLDRLKAGERLGTLLSPERGMLAARKQWLAGHLQTRGTLVLDAGAVQALRQANKSLLPVGGEDRAGQLPPWRDGGVRRPGRSGSGPRPGQLQRLEAQKIIGQPSDAIERWATAPSRLVHRDNLILV
jgi:glutamate 5-kinase